LALLHFKTLAAPSFFDCEKNFWLKKYIIESHTIHSSLRDVLKMSWVRSQECVLWIYLNMIGYRKILIGHFISYEILRYPTISFWDILDAIHWNIRRIASVNLGQFEVFLRIKCVVWIWCVFREYWIILSRCKILFVNFLQFFLLHKKLI